MTKILPIAALAAGLMASSPALAASLQAVQGEVSINHGEGFQHVAGPMDTRVGDLVLASQGGSAKLVYADGCTVRVVPATVVRVGAKSPCKAMYYSGLIEPEEPEWDPGFWPFFAGAGGVFLTACIAEMCDDNDHPKSK